MGLFRKARFKIGLLSLSLLSKFVTPDPVSWSKRQRLERDLSRELQTQQQRLDAVIALIEHFRSEYAQLSLLLERTFQELLRQNDHAARITSARRYAHLFEEKDRRLFDRWQEVKHAMERL